MNKIIVVAMLLAFAICAHAQTQEVSRFAFTTNVVDNEPVDILFDYDAAKGSNINFFAELRNMQGKRHHLWYKNGELVFDYTVTVSGARWRTRSSMKAANFKTGDEVIVEVTDDSGNVYAVATLSII